MWLTKKWLVTGTAVALVALGGCGTSAPASGQAKSPDNPPFSMKTAQDRVTPNPAFDPGSASVARYGHIQVYDANGQKVVLDARRQPILFEAYWCPHCQRTLKLFEQKWANLPIQPVIVSMGFNKGTTVSQALQIGGQEVNALGLKNMKVYYTVDPNVGDYVTVGFPTLVFNDRGTLQALYGEHTYAAWQTALALAAQSTASA